MGEISIKPEDIEYDDNDMISLYANSVQMQMSIYDLQFIFGSQYSSNKKTKIKQLARVIMSPQHAKALAGILSKHVSEYEKKFGKINLPDMFIQGE